LKLRELHELAKAAINGDEAALEMFEYKQMNGGGGKKSKKNKMDTKSIFMSSAETLCFMLSGDKGSVYYINENAKFSKLYQMDNGIVKLMYNHDKQMLISITDNQMLGQYSVKSEFEVKNLMTVKLSGRSSNLDFCWIGSNLLAYAGGEGIIRYSLYFFFVIQFNNV
jgi:hypothetical protein